MNTLPAILNRATTHQISYQTDAANNYFNLTQQKAHRVTAIISYLLIILMGQIIGLPVLLWLIFTLFDFGNIDQLFALMAIVGLTIISINHNKIRTSKILALDLLCFLLLASPIIRRMTAVPIELFNYLAFIIPTTLFALFYTASLFLGYRQCFQKKIVAC
ncbi:MAG: hypothetical protein V4722_00725 [Bacteroidota bacterium]